MGGVVVEALHAHDVVDVVAVEAPRGGQDDVVVPLGVELVRSEQRPPVGGVGIVVELVGLDELVDVGAHREHAARALVRERDAAPRLGGEIAPVAHGLGAAPVRIEPFTEAFDVRPDRPALPAADQLEVGPEIRGQQLAVPPAAHLLERPRALRIGAAARQHALARLLRQLDLRLQGPVAHVPDQVVGVLLRELAQRRDGRGIRRAEKGHVRRRQAAAHDGVELRVVVLDLEHVVGQEIGPAHHAGQVLVHVPAGRPERDPGLGVALDRRRDEAQDLAPQEAGMVLLRVVEPGPHLIRVVAAAARRRHGDELGLAGGPRGAREHHRLLGRQDVGLALRHALDPLGDVLVGHPRHRPRVLRERAHRAEAEFPSVLGLRVALQDLSQLALLASRNLLRRLLEPGSRLPARERDGHLRDQGHELFLPARGPALPVDGCDRARA